MTVGDKQVTGWTIGRVPKNRARLSQLGLMQGTAGPTVAAGTVPIGALRVRASTNRATLFAGTSCPAGRAHSRTRADARWLGRQCELCDQSNTAARYWARQAGLAPASSRPCAGRSFLWLCASLPARLGRACPENLLSWFWDRPMTSRPLNSLSSTPRPSLPCSLYTFVIPCLLARLRHTCPDFFLLVFFFPLSFSTTHPALAARRPGGLLAHSLQQPLPHSLTALSINQLNHSNTYPLIQAHIQSIGLLLAFGLIHPSHPPPSVRQQTLC